MLVGLLRPSGGMARINGIDIWQEPLAAKQQIGVLPEGLVTSPPALPLALAYWRDLPWLGVVGLLLGGLYATVVFWYGMQLAGRLLLQREAEVVAALRQPSNE
jgi:hypothetical protein